MGDVSESTIVNSMVPKHEQVRAHLERMCTDDLAPGDMLPSERQLCVDFGVSRITVRDAIGQLVNDGMLVRVRGKGTYVAERQVRSRLHLASFHEDMRRQGLNPTTVVIRVETCPPPPRTAVALGLRASDPGHHIVRLRIADGQPISVDDAWYHGPHLPDLVDTDLSASIYETLSHRFGTPIDRAEQTVAAREAPEWIATMLGIATGAPVLAFDRIGRHGEQPLEHTCSWYRADRYELHMELREDA
ncbi:GntR family transcriptional regulator [Williamsia sp. CHRR-6]|uniref:GntR family transcriptional regulator n=1 Tax=Williamsia sp. CHRR-6 TaxID=2835871 RepID=UPI001BD93125|nr:GntR family transcriptional regulator [Williamsia sp. CHRR-6]MBT0568551.1 GntR family transcriptional regulator [Williamsia sp. CHRR-6]